MLVLRLLIVAIEDCCKGLVLSLLSSKVVLAIWQDVRNILNLDFLLGARPVIACQLDNRSLELMIVLIADNQRSRRDKAVTRLQYVLGKLGKELSFFTSSVGV